MLWLESGGLRRWWVVFQVVIHGITARVLEMMLEGAPRFYELSRDGGGFFQVVNHGIPARVLEMMLEGARRFYELPREVKAEYYTREELKKIVKFMRNFDVYESKSANWRDTLFCVMGPEPLYFVLWVLSLLTHRMCLLSAGPYSWTPYSLSKPSDRCASFAWSSSSKHWRFGAAYI